MISRLLAVPVRLVAGALRRVPGQISRRVEGSGGREQPSLRTVELAPSPRPATEAEIVARIVEHLGDLVGSASSLHFAAEVRTHGRSRADVLVLADDDLVAVEAKLTDWRRALGQAALNQSVVDLSYVAMWQGRTSPDLLTHAAAEGIGVVGVSPGGLSVLVSPRRGRPDPTVRSALVARLHETADGGGRA